ncbi:hypothetical protein [Novosphingobium sp.]|uniref:hypothetical protein n=1 Tax=Novosphingobium sp. TaxID=1874826 RepID=UPI0025CF0643|nr:hypothetical protein [Novosphingobium sp.]
MPSHFPTLALAAVISLGLTQAAQAAPQPSTRLVKCASGSCLLVRGHRVNPAAAVSINGHAIATAGAHKWHARVPVETLRGWSEPYARTITVAVADATTEAGLPIGLFGHTTNLAMITISRK